MQYGETPEAHRKFADLMSEIREIGEQLKADEAAQTAAMQANGVRQARRALVSQGIVDLEAYRRLHG